MLRVLETHEVASRQGPLRLTASSLIVLHDVYKPQSTWSTIGILAVAESVTDWNTHRDYFGEVSMLNAIQQARDYDATYKAQSNSTWSLYDLGVSIVSWFEAADQPLGVLAVVADHRRIANSFSKDSLNYRMYAPATQVTAAARSSCVVDERGKKVIRLTGLETTSALQALSLPAAVVTALNGTSAGFSDCTVVVFGRFRPRSSNTILGTQINSILKLTGGTTGAASHQTYCGRLSNDTDFAALGCAAVGFTSSAADKVFVTRPFPRAYIWGARLPFGDDTGLSTNGAINSSCVAFAFGATEWSTYFNGYMTSGTVPAGLGVANYSIAIIGHDALQSYLDIERIVVFGAKLTRSQLLLIEEWNRRDADRIVYWIGGNFCTITYENFALSTGNTTALAVTRRVEDQLGGRYTHVNLSGSALSTPWDILNNWDLEVGWRIRPGDVVVLWATDGAVDATYDPLIVDRANEVIVQEIEICRRVKALGGIPVVPRVPKWGSFYEPYPSVGPWEKATMLETVNAYIEAHPTEFSTSSAGCPNLDLPQLNPAVDNVTYYGGSTSEAMTTAGHALVAPLLTEAIRSVAPVQSIVELPSNTLTVLSNDYLNQGNYLFYADETSIAESAAVTEWIAREGSSLTGTGGTAVNTWPLLATQTGLAAGSQHAISMVAASSLNVVDAAFGACNGIANVALAVEFTPSNAMAAGAYLLTLRSTDTSSRITVATRATETGGLCLNVNRTQTTGSVSYVTLIIPEISLNIPSFLGIVGIGAHMYIIAVSYAALLPDYWIVPLVDADASSVHLFAGMNTLILNGYAGNDGIIAKIRRLAVWSPSNLTEVKNLLRFWSAKP